MRGAPPAATGLLPLSIHPSGPPSADSLSPAGGQLTIGSLVGIYAAARGLVDALSRLKETGDWNAITDLMVDDREFFEILDLSQYLPGYSKYRIP